MSTHAVNAIYLIAALAAIWDIFFGRGKYLKMAWHRMTKQAARVRTDRRPPVLAIPSTNSEPSGDVPRSCNALAYMASRVTRDGVPGSNYLVEWQRRNQNPKSVQTPNRAQANDQWLIWYQEWKKQPGAFGGAFGTGLNGAPPFTE